MRKFNLEDNLIKITHSVSNDVSAGRFHTGAYLLEKLESSSH
jgi:hypothetical protein